MLTARTRSKSHERSKVTPWLGLSLRRCVAAVLFRRMTRHRFRWQMQTAAGSTTYTHSPEWCPSNLREYDRRRVIFLQFQAPFCVSDATRLTAHRERPRLGGRRPHGPFLSASVIRCYWGEGRRHWGGPVVQPLPWLQAARQSWERDAQR